MIASSGPNAICELQLRLRCTADDKCSPLAYLWPLQLSAIDFCLRWRCITMTSHQLILFADLSERQRTWISGEKTAESSVCVLTASVPKGTPSTTNRV